MRKISILTYANKLQVETILERKKGAYTDYAYIVHNKDDAPPHIHIFMCFGSDRRGADILKWFDNLIDEKGQLINTRFEAVKSSESLLDYLTHKNEADKFQYSEADIIYSSEQAREKLLEDTTDNGFGALDEMLNGIPLREIARRYGKDFIRNYYSYKALKNDIIDEERRIEQKLAREKQIDLIQTKIEELPFI